MIVRQERDGVYHIGSTRIYWHGWGAPMSAEFKRGTGKFLYFLCLGPVTVAIINEAES